jgi:hypothetical protein
MSKIRCILDESNGLDYLWPRRARISIHDLEFSKIEKSVVQEIEEKQKRLSFPKQKYSVKTGIIYPFEIDSQIIKKRMIDFSIQLSELI